MKRLVLVLLLTGLVVAASACSVVTSLTGGNSTNTNAVTELWSDVPKMDGLTPSQIDLPLPIKLVMRTVLGNMGRLNSAGQDQSTGNIDWIVFTSAKTTDDLKNFYTPEKMAASGWQASDQSTCFSGGNAGVAQVGALCVFQKQQGAVQTYLAIIGAQDDQTKQMNVFFLRLEAAGTPTPAQ